MFLRVYFAVSLVLVTAGTGVSGTFDNHILHRNRRQTSGKLCSPLRASKTIVTCFFRNQEVACNSNVEPGTTAKAKCERFYKPTFEPDYSRLTCLDNGTWDNTLFNCVPECGSSSLDRVLFRIINGIEAEPGTFPWHAGLYYRQSKNGVDTWVQQCSGSLITDQFVITVAHCVADTVENDLRVALGKYYRDWDRSVKGEIKRTVTKIIYQGDFSKKVYTFDIALLRLDEEVQFGETIMPVCRGFPGGSTYLENKNLYVAGWGRTKEGDITSASNTLVYNTVTVVNQQVCKRAAPSVYPTFDKFCTIKGGQSITDVSIVQPGDSGGGITSLYDGLHFILGAVSAKEKQYSIFTNFTWPYNVIWIENEIRKYDSSFRWDVNDITELKNDDRGCLLPEASPSRNFCSMAAGCVSCDIHDRSCFIPPGYKVYSVRVVCAPGYTLRSPYSGGDVAICMNGQWYPAIPECHRYQYLPANPWNRVTWQEARDNCVNKGYILATIKNEGENENFKETALEFYKRIGMEPGNLWIGLNDLKVEGTFEWMDGSILSKSDFNRWRQGEPSNSDEIEHCAVAEDDFSWGDNYCSQLNYYFCKQVEPSDALLDRISDFGEIIRDTQRYTYLPGNPWRKVTWDEARDNCVAKGSHLAIIRDADQQRIFEEAVSQQFKDTNTIPDHIWIGLRTAKYMENIYYWTGDRVTPNIARIYNWTDGSILHGGRGGWNNWVLIKSEFDCTAAMADHIIREGHSNLYQWDGVQCEDLNYYFCSIKLL